MAFSNNNDADDFKGSGEQRTLLTIIGDHASLDGKFKVSNTIEVDCELKGKLTVDGKLTIQKNGNVNADVKTNEAEIIGRYEGNMEASGYVEIKETGVAVGNIKTDSLIINKGGIFSGSVARINEQQAASKKKSKDEAGFKVDSDINDFVDEKDIAEAGSDFAVGAGEDKESFGSSDDENLSL